MVELESMSEDDRNVSHEVFNEDEPWIIYPV